MSENQIDVRIRVQTGELNTGMNAAAASVQEATARMRQSMQDISARMNEALSQVRQMTQSAMAGVGQQLQAIQGQMSEFAQGIASSASGVSQALMALPGPLKALGIAVGAVFAGKHFVDGAAETTKSVMDLARVMGSSTNEAQKWRLAVDGVGASQEELEGAAKGMSRQLRENEEELQKLGLVTRDANGHLRPMTDLLQDGIGIVNQYKEGADRAQVAQEMFGRGIDASSRLLLLNNEGLANSEKQMKELGLEVGANAVAAWKEFDEASDNAGKGVQGISYTIGGILMPVITQGNCIYSE